MNIEGIVCSLAFCACISVIFWTLVPLVLFGIGFLYIKLLEWFFPKA